MKKVGIITLNCNSNFGGKLQNYAVEKKLQENGMDVQTIWKINNKFIVKEIIKKFFPYITKFKRQKMFWNFGKKHMNFVYEKRLTKELSKKFDYFIVGSDQIWNYSFGESFDKMFATFAEDKKKIAFSASFGVNDIPEEYKPFYRENLLKFKDLSVREDAGKKIINELTNRKDVEVIVDPTMLLSKEHWKNIGERPKKMFDGKYILNYFLGELSEKSKKQVYDIANKNGWKVINILDKNDPFYVSGPSEFVYLEEHAELICTDSFHSCVFGILMETPFIVFDRVDHNKNMNSRIETLLSKFDLEDRKYNGVITNELLQCDFSHCANILKLEREKADKFLKNALEIEK